MKTKRLVLVLEITMLLVTSTKIRLAAQENSERIGDDRQHVRYRLVDLGTFGGPNSSDVASPIMNNQGAITGGADTADSDPNAPNCYAPDCFVMHAYVWRQGVFTDLGGLPGGFGSEGNWINDYNQIAGQSLNGLIDPRLGTPAAVAVLWKSNGQIVDLGTLGGNQSLAATINNRKQVVGAAANAIPDVFSMFGWGTQTRAFLWEKGVMRDLGDLGGPDAFAISVNERSQVAGVSYTSSIPSPVATQWCGQDIPPQNPFLWEKGKMINLGTLGGICGFPAAISGLNNQGQVVGQSDLAGDFTAHPFLWDSKRHPHLRDLGTLGGTFVSALGLNDAGEVVGFATTPDDVATHAFFWSNGVMKDLGTVKGDGCSVAYHINAGGQVVGTSGDGCDEVHAFFWQRGGPMMDLNDLVPSGPGLVLTAGEFINDRGEIGASGVLPNGDHHAILLIPCDDEQGNIEGWVDAMQDAKGTPSEPESVAAASITHPKISPSETMAKIRARLARRYHIASAGAPRNSKR